MTETTVEGALTLFSDYTPPEGSHDEMLVAAGQMRPHTERFLAALGGKGRRRFVRGATLAERLVRENGIAYGPPDAVHRPWELDPLPMLLDGGEWRTLVAGLEQRWRLLDLLARDVYGEQRVLRAGVPPELVFGDPQFLRPFAGMPTPERMLHLYAADVARAPDGQWWIVGDRTNAASGLGFALENRIVSARVFPELLEACHVERHAPFFIGLKRTLASLAPSGTEDPHVVLLTEDTMQPAFFEDSFLARYLGLTLARFDDLAVRNERVYLKTLEGLLPVDVILRRPNGSECDPLELVSRNASRGVAGLVQAIRAGNVGTANALGTGLFESPVWMAFLPNLCRELLGEELAIPNVATWWCGQEQELTQVLSRLDKLTIMPAVRNRGRDARELRILHELPKPELAARILANPTAYCAQEVVTRSSTPTWSRDGVSPAHAALRVFLAATPDGPVALPGGLARVSSSDVPLFVALQRGEKSKDTWIVGDEPVRRVSLLSTSDPSRVVSRHVEPIPSRVAENFFWIGRNLARTETATRVLRTFVGRLVEAGFVETEPGEIRPENAMLLRLLAQQGQVEPGYAIAEMRDRLPAIEEKLAASAHNLDEPGSVRAQLGAFVASASAVRDRISLDGWRILRQAELRFRPPGVIGLPELGDQLDSLLLNLIAFGGLVAEAMTRNASKLMLDVGHRLERALQVAILLDVYLDERSPTSDHLDALLEISDCRMTYRQRFLGPPRTGPVLELLVRAGDNPRSLWSQLRKLRTAVDGLRHEVDPRPLENVRDAIHGLYDLVDDMTPKQFGKATPRLRALLDQLRSGLPTVARDLTHAYFVHAVPIYQPLDVRPR